MNIQILSQAPNSVTYTDNQVAVYRILQIIEDAQKKKRGHTRHHNTTVSAEKENKWLEDKNMPEWSRRLYIEVKKFM